jgi:hypothetical protein
VYACSLDAEKCFDKVWHDGLFYKLFPRIPFNHWLITYEWYTNLKAVVTWNGVNSDTFCVTRGIQQGSILSPLFFIMFIDDLLKELSNSSHGLRLARFLFNNFAYADDITLLAAATVPGLQVLIDISVAYAKKWRFTFGFTKTKCITFDKDILEQYHGWNLGEKDIVSSDSVDMLGVTFNSDMSSEAHVGQRISAANRRAFSLTSDGLCYPGLSSEVKSHLWNMSYFNLWMS